MMKKLWGGAIAGLVVAGLALAALAQVNVFPLEAAVTGAEYILNAANPTGVYFTTKQIAQYASGVTAGVNAQTGTTYTFAAADAGKLVTFSNSGSIAAGLPVATTAGFGSGTKIAVNNIGAGVLTITPTTSTINGQSSLTVEPGRGVVIVSDGTNYQIQPGGAGFAGTPASIAEGGTGSATAGAARTALAVPGLASNNAYTGTNDFGSQIYSTAGLPTIASGACGTTTNGAVVAGSTNQSGQITIGAVATTVCTVTFSAALGVAPNACIIQPMNTAAATQATTLAYVAAPTTGGFVIHGSALANANYAFICL